VSWFDRIFRTPSDPSRAATPVGFEAVAEVVLPAVLAERTQASLREAGGRGNEGLVVWSGVQNASTFAVKSVSVPRQRGIQTAEGVCVVVDGDSLHEVNVATFGRGERLFAQVHSHPGRAYHSPMDDRYAVVTSPGCLSLVVPDFAVRPFSVAECAVFRLARDGRWVDVGAADAARLISIRQQGPT